MNSERNSYSLYPELLYAVMFLSKRSTSSIIVSGTSFVSEFLGIVNPPELKSEWYLLKLMF